jgi:SNF2 family DNA or RNA helicase
LFLFAEKRKIISSTKPPKCHTFTGLIESEKTLKVPSNASFKIVYSIIEHDHLGSLIEAFVVQITSGGNWSMVHQKLNASSAEFYQHKLDELDMQAVALLDQIKPEFLIKKFSPVKRIRPKEYFSKHFNSKVFQNLIRPHIEKIHQEVVRIIHGKNLFLGEKKNPIVKRIRWSDEKATVLFHYRRNDDNTHYFATLKHEGERLNIYHASLLLSNKPCFVVIHDRIVEVVDVDGSKIEPFFRKRFIAIPRASEKTYFTKFGKSIIENYNVYAVGYEIVTKKFIASPMLVLTKLLDGSHGFILKFLYDDHQFYYHGGKKTSVVIEPDGDSLRFLRIKRSIAWEEGIASKLLEMGFKHGINADFHLSANADLQDCIAWLAEMNLPLREMKFLIEQDLENKYELESSEIQFDVSEGIDWFDLKAKVKFGAFEIPFEQIIPYLKRGDLEFPLPNGTFAVLPKEWLSRLSSALDFSTEKDGIKLKKHHLGLLSELNEISPNQTIMQSLNGFNGVQNVAMPKSFEGKLRDYQKAGYDWFYFLKKHNFGGCLADDMGLGKTVQTLALLQNEKELALNSNVSVMQNGQVDLFNKGNADQTSLLVVPTSLTFNWLAEAKKFTPNLKILLHTGHSRVKSSAHFQKYNVVLSTYGTVRNDIDYIGSYEFNYVILDESQFIKNASSKLSKAVNQLQAKHRLTLTGTPIENTVNDLWAQIDFLNTGLLGNQTYFQKHFAAEIEKKGNEQKADKLQALIKPFVLRRTKNQVAKELPNKTEKVVYCTMTEEQEKKYEEVKSKYRNLILGELDSNGTGKSKLNLLQGLMQLRQIANHPKFVDENYEGESGKFEETSMTIPIAIEEGHKILIFSSFVKHLNIFVDHAKEQGIPYCYIDGSVSAKQRKKEVEEFQENDAKKLFFISLKAGGFGLNLTEADYVFILDPWWNPASEQQAIDRTHRIGQNKNVFTYKFITKGTVEEKILALQGNKKSLSDKLIKTEESFIKKLDINDIKVLLS